MDQISPELLILSKFKLKYIYFQFNILTFYIYFPLLFLFRHFSNFAWTKQIFSFCNPFFAYYAFHQSYEKKETDKVRFIAV